MNLLVLLWRFQFSFNVPARWMGCCCCLMCPCVLLWVRGSNKGTIITMVDQTLFRCVARGDEVEVGNLLYTAKPGQSSSNRQTDRSSWSWILSSLLRLNDLYDDNTLSNFIDNILLRVHVQNASIDMLGEPHHGADTEEYNNMR